MSQCPKRARTLVFAAAYLLASLSLLILFPPENWPDGRWPRIETLVHSWSAAPTWHDGDPWFTNYLGHPLMGMILYSFARHSGHSIAKSTAFTIVASTGWEYLLEGWFEQPSYIDLLVTPVAGPALGELRWWARSHLIGRCDELGTCGRILLIALAPIAGRRPRRKDGHDDES